METKGPNPQLSDPPTSVATPTGPIVMVTTGDTPLLPAQSSVSSSETQTSPPVTTISASALVEILNSVATAVLPGDGPNQLQLQLQLGPTATHAIEVVGCMQEVISEEVEGRPMDEGKGGEGKETTMIQKTMKPNKKQGKLKDKQPWHYHLGGVRHCRVPLSPAIKEALEVAYVSRIMSKNFRKEGQPEKERIAQLTGLELDKVQEWFKNRRKKDKLIQSRVNSLGTPKGKRGRKLLLPHSVTRTQKNTNTPKSSSLSTTSTSKPQNES